MKKKKKKFGKSIRERGVEKDFIEPREDQEFYKPIIKRWQIKKQLPTGGPYELQLEKEYQEMNDSQGRKNIYDQALDLEIERTYGLTKLEPNEQLDSIETEIRVRIKITAHEIFVIGGLLILAKTACRKEGIRYKVWLKDKFDMSYETANNMVNVYKNCLGMRSIAIKLPISILTKIGASNFPRVS